ncbi:MAG TPA: hypothetical protein VI299_27115, partial [Polyangiales bacterium]
MKLVRSLLPFALVLPLGCSDGPSAPPRDDANDDTTDSRGDTFDARVRRDTAVPESHDAVPEEAGPVKRDAGRSDAMTSDAAGPEGLDARAPDMPAKSYDWRPGDYPPDLHAQSYLELEGLPGQ